MFLQTASRTTVSFRARSHLQFSVSPCPSLADDLLRCLFLNCQSICLAPGARREDDLFHRLSGHHRGCFPADREAMAAPEQLCILPSAAQISLCNRNSFSWVRLSEPLHQQQPSFSPVEPSEPIKRSMLCLLAALQGVLAFQQRSFVTKG